VTIEDHCPGSILVDQVNDTGHIVSALRPMTLLISSADREVVRSPAQISGNPLYTSAGAASTQGILMDRCFWFGYSDI
jgi:hypothetical protein